MRELAGVIPHPPIPPALENLIEDDEYNGMGCRMDGVDFIGHDEIERLCIACVARSAWLDEESRLRGRSLLGADAARSNAEAWRIWGEQK